MAAWSALLSAAACAVFCVSTLEADSLVEQHVLADESDGTNWPSYGRTFSEAHFSPLRLINSTNVKRLGLAWSLDLDVSNSITAPLAMNASAYRMGRREGRVFALVGGAAVIAGVLIGGDAGTVIAIGGAGLGLYGLYIWQR